MPLNLNKKSESYSYESSEDGLQSATQANDVNVPIVHKGSSSYTEFRLWGSYKDTFGALRPNINRFKDYFSLGMPIQKGAHGIGWTSKRCDPSLSVGDLWEGILKPISQKPTDEFIATALQPRIRTPSDKSQGLYLGRLEETSVAKVSLGKAHTLALTKEGYVLSIGSNEQGQLGIGMDYNHVLEQFQWVHLELPRPEVDPIVDIAADGNTSLALTRNGNLYCWGDCTFIGQGIGLNRDTHEPIDLCFRPTIFKFGVDEAWDAAKIICVVASRQHYAAIDSNNNLWQWGRIFGVFSIPKSIPINYGFVDSLKIILKIVSF